MMRFTILILMAPLLVFSKTPGDYLEYSKRMTQISTLVFSGEDARALASFDSLYHDFDFVYSKDIYLGLQLSGKLRKEDPGFTYLKYAIEHGIIAPLLRKDSLIHLLSEVDPAKWNQLMVTDYESLRSSYLKNIDTPYRRTLDSMYHIDQALTQKLNTATLGLPYYWVKWNHQNKRHARLILKLTDHYGYPGEKIMGISTLSYADTLKMRYGVNCFLGFHQTEFMLIHYFTRKRESLNARLLPEVNKGTMSVYEFAVLNDFMAYCGKKKYKTNYYNEWHESAKEESAPVEKNRSNVGLCSLQLKKEYKAYWKSLVNNKLDYKAIYLPAFL